MIANRELSMEDYLAIGRRRLKVVFIPALIAPLLAFLISFLFTPKYTSHSLLLVKPQVVPAGYVKPIITERVSDRMTTLQQNVLSRSRLQSLVRRLGLVRAGKSEDDVIEAIRANVQISEADPNSPPPGSGSAASIPFRRGAGMGDVTGFYVNFTTDNPRDAQQVCEEITSLLLAENLEVRQQAAESTTDFLSRQLQQAKQNLDVLDQRLSEFKKLHLGRLPSDEDSNLKILMGLAAQLDANTQALSRAQQDKSFAESVLAQEVAAYKALQASPNVPTLRQQLMAMENQLIELQSRYTEDHPDVVKVENDIAELKANIEEMNSASDPDPKTSGENVRAKMEPPDILRLREQIHQNEIIMARATREQKRLQELVDSYQSRLSLSPDVEEQYKQLTRDNETAHTIYDNLMTNENAAQMQTEMERKQQGEQVKLLDPASLPNAPSFPVRWKFATGGLGAGLGMGLCIAFWMELKDKSIRDEGDVLAALELPMLASVPRLGTDENGRDRKGRFRDRLKLGSAA